MQKLLLLSEDQKVMWAEAGCAFSGEQLDGIVQRARIGLLADGPKNEMYEIRRYDVPNAFDALLKLQNDGSVQRYVQVVGDELQEVLRVDVTMLDSIMHAIAVLLDVVVRVLGGALRSSSNDFAEAPVEPPAIAPVTGKYVADRKVRLRIEHDDFGYSP